MKDKRWPKHFATCNTTQYFSELIKIAQFYLSVMAGYAVERFFPWCSHKPKRKRCLSGWTSFYKLVCNSKHLSCNSFI